MERYFAHTPKWVLLLEDASYVTYHFHAMISPLGAVILAKAGIPVAALSVVLCLVIGLLAEIIIYLLIDHPTTRLLGRWI